MVSRHRDAGKPGCIAIAADCKQVTTPGAIEEIASNAVTMIGTIIRIKPNATIAECDKVSRQVIEQHSLGEAEIDPGMRKPWPGNHEAVDAGSHGQPAV
jgi:hypothetical protein